MERKQKATGGSGLRSFSKRATVVFLILAALAIYLGVALCVRFASHELARTPNPDMAELLILQTPAPTKAVLPAEDGSEAASILTDIPAETPPLPSVLPEPSVFSTVTPSGAPSPLPAQTHYDASFTDSRADILVYGFTEHGNVDAVMLVSLRSGQIAVTPLRRDTLVLRASTWRQLQGASLSAQDSSGMLSAVQSVLPVAVGQYIRIDFWSAAECVDLLGGIEVGGVLMDGETAVRCLLAEGLSESSRIQMQQRIITAFLARLSQTGIVRLTWMKSTFAKSLHTNVTLPQLLQLYQILRKTGDTPYITIQFDYADVSADGVCGVFPTADSMDVFTRELFN